MYGSDLTVLFMCRSFNVINDCQNYFQIKVFIENNHILKAAISLCTHIIDINC